MTPAAFRHTPESSLAKEMRSDCVAIYTAKTTLSQLLAHVEAGAEIDLPRGKNPIAKLALFKPLRRKRGE